MKTTEQLEVVLATQFGGCRGVATFRVRTLSLGIRDTSTLTLDGIATPVIPLGVLKRLGESPVPEVCVRAATTESVGALSLSIPTRDADTSTAVLARWLAFAAPPTFVLDAATSMVACWRLAAPAELPPAHGPAGRLLGQLARAVGVPTTAAELPIDSWVPLPGSAVREAGTPVPIVGLAHYTPEIRYSFAALHAASKGGPLCATR